ncbi:nucleoid-associated protein [Clostridium beijerinckii]|uniref:nucleoid-associated protein n=1 Tax=Clostridium beijerinckii TaxID=1520 RepID=UPI00098C1EDE|nr:nucleoid-associated protein [Clostridium beijerinckii]NRT76278.1 nucleoid-associated protein YejK [Clostridium beijerinckii]OOM38502.1 nucleoid-associated protein YejK [Clostridium beijerinckii]
MEFINLKIERVIIHKIFKRNIDKELVEPLYSKSLSVLDTDGIEVLKERVINAIGNKSNSLEMGIIDISEGSCVKCVDESIRSDENTFIENSKKITYKLAKAQSSRRIPGGIVLIFEGTIGLNNKRICGIIKADLHSGFTTTKIDGQNEVLKYLSDLLLTPEQKLYKIAVFIEDNQNSNNLADKYTIFVYDHNMKKTETKDAATYFYDLFLGCDFKNNSKLLTQHFYEGSKEFINSLELPDEEKLDLNLELYSYIKSNVNATISIDDFSNNSLKREFRDSYSTFMIDKKIPATSINKDTQYLETRLKQRKIKFSNEISIIGPSEEFSKLIKILPSDNNDITKIEINGKIKYQQ